MNKRYACEGTLLYHKNHNSFAVIVYSTLGGGGAPFKTLAYADQYNSHHPFQFLETNDSPELYGWEVVDNAAIVLYATPKIAERVERLKAMVRLGYRGLHHTRKDLMDELEWRMSQ